MVVAPLRKPSTHQLESVKVMAKIKVINQKCEIELNPKEKPIKFPDIHQLVAFVNSKAIKIENPQELSPNIQMMLKHQ
jgi:hypothetical protein